MRRSGVRTASVAVAYLMLLLAVFIAETFLATVYIGLVYKTTSYLPEIVESFGSGLVYGSYTVGPFYHTITEDVNGRLEKQIVYTDGLFITLINPNPMQAEVVIIGYVQRHTSTEKVIDLLGAFDVDITYRTSGVKLVTETPRWFPQAQSYLIMPPHSVVSFVIPTFGSEIPSIILACTKVGCTKLEEVGEMSTKPYVEYQWVITGKLAASSSQIETPSAVKVAVSQQWQWEAVTIAGPFVECVQPPTHTTIIFNGQGIKCCIPCPPGWEEISKGGRAPCGLSRVSGSIPSYSAIEGLPANVIAGFFVTDSSYKFETPKTIMIGGHKYRLYGFRKGPGETTEDLIPSAWLNYDGISCQDRKITITIVIQPKVGNMFAKFSDVWTKSKAIYVYVGVKGFYNFLPYERDTVSVTVKYRVGETWVTLGTVKSSDNRYVDNSPELASSPSEWSVPINANMIMIIVTYYMEGPSWFRSTCFTFLNPCGSGSGSDRKVRLGFYVELIPSEYLS